MESTRGFAEVRKDPEWLSRTLVLSVFMLSTMCIPFLGQAVVEGVAVETMKRDLRGERGLPVVGLDSATLSTYLEPGFKVILVQFVWTFLAILVTVPLILVGVVGTAAMAREAGGSGGEALMPIVALGTALGFIAFMVFVGGMVLVAQIRVSLTGKLGDAFAVGAMLGSMRRLGADLFVGMFVNGMLFMVIGLFSYLMCVLPVLLVAAFAPLSLAYFKADLARLDVERGGDLPLPQPHLQVAAETFA